jgi:hypothetical protein
VCHIQHAEEQHAEEQRAVLASCRCFKGAVEQKLDPVTFVEGLKKQGKRVPGIGHRIKSKDNRDARVELLQRYARKVCLALWAGFGHSSCVCCVLESDSYCCRTARHVSAWTVFKASLGRQNRLLASCYVQRWQVNGELHTI